MFCWICSLNQIKFKVQKLFMILRSLTDNWISHFVRGMLVQSRTTVDVLHKCNKRQCPRNVIRSLKIKLQFGFGMRWGSILSCTADRATSSIPESRCVYLKKTLSLVELYNLKMSSNPEKQCVFSINHHFVSRRCNCTVGVSIVADL